MECVFGDVPSSVDKLSSSLQLKTLDGLYVRGCGASLELRYISPYSLNDGVAGKILDPPKNKLVKQYTFTVLFCIRNSSVFLGSKLAIIVEIHFKGLYMTYEYTFSLDSATHINLHVKDMIVLYSDWPVQYYILQCFVHGRIHDYIQ